VLLDADDFVRMNKWAKSYFWAKDARDQIIRNAENYPPQYMRSYNLTTPDLPPTGGQWWWWYVCPDGVMVQYKVSNTPPHYCASTNQFFASPPQWPNRPTLYDEVIYSQRHDRLAAYARDNGLAYSLTKDKKYADNAAAILRAYAKAYPTYPHHDNDGKTSRSGAKAHSQTLDEAIWLIDVAWAYDLVGDTLSPADRATIADNVLRLAVVEIQGNREGLSNRQTWHNAGIAAVGFALGDEGLVNEAYRDPENGFFVQLAKGAEQDGFWWESTWHYHFYTLQPMLYLAEMGIRAGIDTYGQPNLRAMINVPIQAAMSDLTMPRFNDDFGRSLPREWVYEIAYNRYRDPIFASPIPRGARDWRALLWGVESLPTSRALLASSILLPKAGYAFLRAGEANDLQYLAFDFGPHGREHGHYDKLGYISFAMNRVLGIDSGVHSYASSLYGGWDKTTLAHNTVVVDERNQNEATGNLHRFVAFPDFGIVSADAGNAYPNRATIVRTLALNKDYWLDVTRAVSLDNQPHRFDWIYHNSGTLSIPFTVLPYPAFPNTGGYRYLTNPMSALTNADWQVTWDANSTGQPYGSVLRNDGNVAATFTITRTSASDLVGQMDYNFSTVSNGYVVYYSTNLYNPPSGTPTHISARVYGDGSKNRLGFRIVDGTGERFSKEIGPITWTGWQTVTATVDRTWSHWEGNEDGAIDAPIMQVAVQVTRATGGMPAGQMYVDDLALTFPKAGQVVMENFEGAVARVDLKMLAAPETTVVVGNGIYYDNTPIPFTMARRQGIETTFAAIFEPYRTSPRISTFQAVPVSPTVGSPTALRIVAPTQYTDTFMIADENARADRTFGTFSTDATTAYVRYDNTNTLQTLILANATKFSSGTQAIVTSTVPITAQLSFVGDTLAVTTQGAFTTQLRVFAPAASKLNVNGNVATMRRDGEYVVLDLTGK
jgi:hypothetical protein